MSDLDVLRALKESQPDFHLTLENLEILLDLPVSLLSRSAALVLSEGQLVHQRTEVNSRWL